MADLQKIAKLVSLNIPQTQIAHALGLSEGRISQLISEDIQLQSLIASYQGALAERETDNVITLSTIENTLLGQIQELATQPDSLGEAIRALEGIVKIKSSKLAPDSNHPTPGKATLVINNIIQNSLYLNVELTSNNEIAAIGGRSMVTMPKEKVMKLIESQGVSNGQQGPDSGGQRAGQRTDSPAARQTKVAEPTDQELQF